MEIFTVFGLPIKKIADRFSAHGEFFLDFFSHIFDLGQ